MSATHTTVIVAFLEQDNLGVGYLVSRLTQDDFPVKVVDFRSGNKTILESIKRIKPKIVGFSIIFQYHIYEFKHLIDYLRENGVSCHFTAGGHYPSLRSRETFEIIDKLDSIVLFEGEHTFAELVAKVNSGIDWTRVEGIALRDNNLIRENKLRPLEMDIDIFPPPARQPLKDYVLGKKYATLVAGRGCFYNCSFCSIRKFYSKPPGPVKRLRRPEMVVREMELLHHERDCSVFMFQDDDFPVTANQGNWINEFCSLLHEKNLSNDILWKINCRADEVSSRTFEMMKEAGLFLVYLGIESGTEDGLKLMNKRLQPSDNQNAINTLKNVDIGYDYGFMLFEPTSTIETVKENLIFLDEMFGDGTSPITFCKMVPYAETLIEEQLKKQNRLKGDLGFLDYDFLDSRLDKLCPFLIDAFQPWITSHNGILNLARWARYNIMVADRFCIDGIDTSFHRQKVQGLVAESNRYFINMANLIINIICTDKDSEKESRQLAVIKMDVEKHHNFWKAKFFRMLDEFSKVASHEIPA